MALAAGHAAAADSNIFAVTTTASSATITLTPPPLNSCNANIVWRGTASGPSSQDDIVWVGSYELLSTDSALASTPRFAGIANDSPEYFTPRTVTINIDPGTYTVGGKCTPYDAAGNFAGDDTQHTKTFNISASPDPTEPDDNENAWGSLESLFP